MNAANTVACPESKGSGVHAQVVVALVVARTLSELYEDSLVLLSPDRQKDFKG